MAVYKIQCVMANNGTNYSKWKKYRPSSSLIVTCMLSHSSLMCILIAVSAIFGYIGYV